MPFIFLMNLMLYNVIIRKKQRSKRMNTQPFTISPIPDDIFAKMQGKSFKDNCTVPREDLRYLKVLHVGFDGKTHIGELVVNRLIADDVLDIFK